MNRLSELALHGISMAKEVKQAQPAINLGVRFIVGWEHTSSQTVAKLWAPLFFSVVKGMRTLVDLPD